jgi:hypothetical protein
MRMAFHALYKMDACHFDGMLGLFFSCSSRVYILLGLAPCLSLLQYLLNST